MVIKVASRIKVTARRVRVLLSGSCRAGRRIGLAPALGVLCHLGHTALDKRRDGTMNSLTIRGRAVMLKRGTSDLAVAGLNAIILN